MARPSVSLVWYLVSGGFSFREKYSMGLSFVPCFCSSTPAIEFWVASVAIKNSLDVSGATSMRSVDSVVFSETQALFASGPHLNLVFFLVRLKRGVACSAKLGMKSL